MEPSVTSRRTFLRIAGALSASALAGGFTGACTPGVGGGGSTAVDPNQPKPPRLRMLYATAEANAIAVQALLPEFRRRFGMELVMDTQPYDALQQKVFAEFASQSSYYDIIIVDTPWAPALVGSLEPLGGLVTDPRLNDMAAVDVGDFIPKVFHDTAVYTVDRPIQHYPDPTAAPDVAAIRGAGFDVYGLPIQANGLVMAYRKDLFDDPAEQAAFQARSGRPLAVPATWDDYVAVAEHFTRPDQQLHGTTVMAGVGDWATCDFKSLLASFGGDGHLVGDDLSLRFAGREGERALTFYHDLINKAQVVPPGSTAASWDETASLFDTGRTAMTMNYHTLELAPQVGGEIGYAAVPRGRDTGPHFGTWMLSVNRYSTNKAWAYRAISWLTAGAQQQVMTAQQLHPTRTSVYGSVAAGGGVDPALAGFYEVLGGSLEVGVGRPRLTNYTEVSHAIAVAVNEAATGAQEPQPALDGAAEEVRRLLEQAGYEVPS